MKTPACKQITMTFHSHPTKSLAMRWTAKVHFPPGADGDTPLAIDMVDGEGTLVSEAVFEFAGKRLRVRDGRTSILYSDFVRGKHAKSVWVYRHGMLPIPGGLTFE